MSNLNRDNGLDKLTLGFVTVMSVIMLLSLGADLRDHDYFQIATTGTSILFFLGLGALVINLRWRELKDRVIAAQRDVENERRLREMDMNRSAATKVAEVTVPELPFPAELRQFIDEVVMPDIKEMTERKQNNDMLRAIIMDTGGFPLTEDRIPAVEAAFHENADEYVKITLEDEGKSLNAEFSKTPIEATPIKDLAPGVATTEATKKPLTKSQQRRINTQKGLGALTDDEVREAKNEKRRAARAAKKAEEDKSGGTTTTTTTQPGQTSLV